MLVSMTIKSPRMKLSSPIKALAKAKPPLENWIRSIMWLIFFRNRGREREGGKVKLELGKEGKRVK